MPASRARGLPRGATPLGGTSRRETSSPEGRRALAGRPSPERLAARPRRPQRVADLAPGDRRAYTDAIETLHEMRARDLSLATALSETNTGRPRGERLTPQRARALLGPALRRAGGRWRPSAADSLPRRLRLLGPDGPAVVEVKGDRQAAVVAHFEGALARWAGGDPAPLRRLHGRGVRLANGERMAFLTDEARLRVLGRAGLLGLPDGLYAGAEVAA